jgi:hypothetical protein
MIKMESKIQKSKFIPYIHSQLNGILGFLIIGFIAISITFISSRFGLMAISLLTIALLGVIFVLLSFIIPKLGFFSALLIPFIGFELQRYLRIDIPIGFLVQVIFILLLAIILLKSRMQGGYNFSSLNNPITYTLIASYVYLIIQCFNPEMGSLEGWFFALRSVSGRYLIFFIALVIINDLKFVKQFFYAWFILAFISAIYACYQEWFGLPSFVLNYIHSDPLKLGLYYINGKYRVFSLLSDPAAFGIFMAGSFLVTVIVSIYSDKKSKKIMLSIAALFMLLASAYSGTRTGYAMIPAGLLLFTLMTITNKKTLLVTAVVSLAFAVLIFGPFYGNSTLNRIRSTFNGDDASLNVRDVNRARIQEYIYQHPLGGGIMTVGVAGLKYNPEHKLAGFPPDSGYLYAVLEIGWLGFILFLLFFFVSMRESIKSFYRCEDNNIKFYYLAIAVFTFSITIASYAQVVIGQIPISLFFYPSLAIIIRLKSFEKVK